MNPSHPSHFSNFSKDRDLLWRLFVYDKERHVWVYNHDDQVFKVMAACAKLNVPCRNVPKDDPITVEITDEDWDRIFVLPLITDSPSELPSQEVIMKTSSTESRKSPLEKRVLKVIQAFENLDAPHQHNQKDNLDTADVTHEGQEHTFILPHPEDSLSEPPSQEVTMTINPSESIDAQTPLEQKEHSTETKVRHYRFDGANDDALESKAEEILLAAESQMADEEEQDMEKALHALAEQTHPVFVSPEENKDLTDDIRSFLSSPIAKAEEPEDPSTTPLKSFQNPKDASMNQDENQTKETRHFGDLSSWEQVLEDRESTLAAREKVLRLRQKDIQDMEERLHEERKAFNADYEEKKAFLEDKEQRLKKIFERIEEVAYEFRRTSRSEGEAD
jgi:hypothetical protein